MRSPFPGMDPYLEHPVLWPDSHNSLIITIADQLTPKVAPRYYIGLGRRAYQLNPNDMMFTNHLDIAISAHQPTSRPGTEAGVLEVEVPMTDEVGENFLEVREVHTGKLEVTGCSLGIDKFARSGGFVNPPGAFRDLLKLTVVGGNLANCPTKSSPYFRSD